MHFFVGIFLLAFEVLALQVALGRLLSVTSWYHLAFFAIAIAMLGMTAGTTRVYFNPLRFSDAKNEENLAWACLQQAWSVPLSLVVLCLTPIIFEPNVMVLLSVLMVASAAFLPFFYGGIATTLVLTKSALPVGKLYAWDLVGASMGCPMVLVGMNVLDAPSLILLCGALGGLAGLAFSWRLPKERLRLANAFTFFLLAALAVVNSTSPRLIRPLVVKGRIVPATDFLLERWNSFSRVTVDHPVNGEPQYWQPAWNAPRDKNLAYGMAIDGQAGTIVRRFQRTSDIEHLRYDLTNVAYHLRPHGGACIIGVGGGRDLQSAILFGHERVTGVDINPIFIDLLKNQFRDFAGLANRPEVTLVADDARSYLSRSQEKFSLIRMSLIDTWASTGAGAYSLTENSLYTVEAWQAFIRRLADDGIFTVSRWYIPENLGETGRLISLAAASAKAGLEPSKHIALITHGRLATLLLSKQPLTSQDLDRLRQVTQEYRFEAAILPGTPIHDPVLRQLIGARSISELERMADAHPLRIGPTTDESPYFFNILKLSRLDQWNTASVARGNIVATMSLLALIATLLLITAVTVVIPFCVQRWDGIERHGLPQWSGALYFSLIGCCFMLVEIGTIQRLSVLLSHPSYALGVLLFSLILSTGVGNMLSEKLPLARRPYVYLYPLACAATILLANGLLNVLVDKLIYASIAARITASVLVIFPLGISLGVSFNRNALVRPARQNIPRGTGP